MATKFEGDIGGAANIRPWEEIGVMASGGLFLVAVFN